jgi:ABC-type multidrug transport system fused ATPase/permease subunit
VGYWAGYFLVFSWGAVKLINKKTTFGSVTAMLQLIGNIQGPFNGLASSLPQIISAYASSERIMEIEALKSDKLIENQNTLATAGIEFENVNFSYKADTPILKDLSVKLKQGETVALVGASGEGKTTIINLLLSLINPDSGEIRFFDEANSLVVNSDTRKYISYVPQGNTLFSGTIMDNLLRGNENATEEEVEQAARAACAWGFIHKSKAGLQTEIGERGVGLSEGQAQRLAIARALLHKTPILILDEATSALDGQTEIEVLKAINKLEPAPTCIIITHRTTALKICDRVLKLEGFSLVEQSFTKEEL